MTWLKSLRDRRRRQRGSVLSGLLIIVAFIAILVGALMTELTSSFLVSRTVVARQLREATVTSAVELGIHRLQTTGVPPVCAQDARGPWFLSLNNSQAAVTQTCVAIVPDLALPLQAGSYPVDGVHDLAGGQDRYVVNDSSGVLRAYLTGNVVPRWTVATGGTPTAAPMTKDDPNGSVDLLIPEASGGSGCGGQCVALFNEAGAAPTLRCTMPASSTVSASPGAESTAGTPNFPGYAFFGGSGASGQLYVYDASAGGGCTQLGSASLSGSPVGRPLVFTGTVRYRSGITTTRDEVFVLVSDGSNTNLRHFQYTEVSGGTGGTTRSLASVASLLLTSQVGGTAVGYAISSETPTVGTTMTLAVAGSSGAIATVNIAVGSGPTYTASLGGSTALPSAISRAPTWCHCPGRDLIGVGSTNGTLYLLTAGLSIQWSYDGSADGRPAINTTPAADQNGDWYFGADDGYAYDVEIPTTGSQLFKAARFGPGGAIRSSPVVGDASVCGGGPCVYFGSSTLGTYYAVLGSIRVIDLQACVSTAFGSTSCAVNPRLWARVEVGNPDIIGLDGVLVQGWSYYSP